MSGVGTWQLVGLVAGSTLAAGGVLVLMACIWPADLDRGTRWQDWGLAIPVVADAVHTHRRVRGGHDVCRERAGWYPGPEPGYL